MQLLLKNSIVRRSAVGLISLGLVAVGWFGNSWWSSQRPLPRRAVQQIRQSTFVSSTHQFINPLLACEAAGRKEPAELTPLKQQIEQLVNEEKNAGHLGAASIYFDTRDGNWLSLNLTEKYFPASLMKVPTMIALLKKVEGNPALLQKKVTYHNQFNLNEIEFFKPAVELKQGQRYSLEELMEHLILYSDNNALPPLLENIGENELREVFTDLGITIPADANETLADFVTVKSYANFFRVLYNATYLSRDMSEKALALLSQPNFKNGLMAGLPPNTKVAKKFGERNFGLDPNDKMTLKELHDCGIIYYPDHNYLLCVMTKGNDFDQLANVIKKVSSLVYSYMDQQYGK